MHLGANDKETRFSGARFFLHFTAEGKARVHQHKNECTQKHAEGIQYLRSIVCVILSSPTAALSSLSFFLFIFYSQLPAPIKVFWGHDWKRRAVSCNIYLILTGRTVMTCLSKDCFRNNATRQCVRDVTWAWMAILTGAYTSTRRSGCNARKQIKYEYAVDLPVSENRTNVFLLMELRG